MNLQESIRKILKEKKINHHNPLEGLFSAEVGDEFITGKVLDLVNLSKNYKTIKLPLSKIPDIPHHSEPEENIYIMNSSLNYPIIVMVDMDGEVERVLDGNHRIQKSLYLGNDTINAKLIPKKDIKRFFGKSNLQESIRRIIREESSRKVRMVKFINNVGIKETIKMIGGFDKFEKIMDINDPMDYLHLFNGMDKVKSEEYKWSSLYRFNPKRNIIMVSPTIERVYINENEIWNILRREFDLNDNETFDVVNEWLKDEYDIEDFIIVVSNVLNTIK